MRNAAKTPGSSRKLSSPGTYGKRHGVHPTCSSTTASLTQIPHNNARDDCDRSPENATSAARQHTDPLACRLQSHSRSQLALAARSPHPHRAASDVARRSPRRSRPSANLTQHPIARPTSSPETSRCVTARTVFGPSASIHTPRSLQTSHEVIGTPMPLVNVEVHQVGLHRIRIDDNAR